MLRCISENTYTPLVKNIQEVITSETYRSFYWGHQQTIEEIAHLYEIFHTKQPISSNFKLTVANIFEHNWNWERYCLEHLCEIEEFQLKQVDIMLACQRKGLGGKIYLCPRCGEEKYVAFTCMSRICSHCGKLYSTSWDNIIMQRYLDVPHRHVIFTLPEELWGYVRKYPKLINAMFQAANETIHRLFDMQFGKDKVRPGMIDIVHFTGRDLKYNPHLHALVTEGGLDENGIWHKHSYWPYESMRRIWQYEIIKKFRRILPKDLETKSMLDALSKSYDGFVVKNFRDLMNIKDLGKYLSRYVRHPPIGESRLLEYDGESIKIKYEWDNEMNTTWIPIDRFIDAILSNIPPKGFQVVRYYGMYSNRLYSSSKKALDEKESQSLVYPKIRTVQESLYDEPICEKCGVPMDLVIIEYWKGIEKVVRIC